MNNASHIGRHCDAFLCAIENSRDAGTNPTLSELAEEAAGYIRDNLARCTCKGANRGPVSIMGNSNGPKCALCGGKIRQGQRMRGRNHAYSADCGKAGGR